MLGILPDCAVDFFLVEHGGADQLAWSRRSCVGDLLTILVLAIMRFVAINLPSGVEEVIAIGILLGFVRVTVAKTIGAPPEKHFLAADFSESQ